MVYKTRESESSEEEEDDDEAEDEEDEESSSSDEDDSDFSGDEEETTDDDDDDEGVSDVPLSLQWPEEKHKQAPYVLLFPITGCLWLTLPDPRRQVSSLHLSLFFWCTTLKNVALSKIKNGLLLKPKGSCFRSGVCLCVFLVLTAVFSGDFAGFSPVDWTLLLFHVVFVSSGLYLPTFTPSVFLSNICLQT